MRAREEPVLSGGTQHARRRQLQPESSLGDARMLESASGIEVVEPDDAVGPPDGAPEVKPPYTPRPGVQQRWVHSCCSAAKLEAALRDSDVTAIEADIMMPRRSASDRSEPAPVMAHPTLSGRQPKSDLTFEAFLDRCIADGTRHLKLDFKHNAAVEPCLRLLAQRWPQLHTNGQAIWLNADVLPGPNARSRLEIPAHTFIPLCRRFCPHAVLSLGWRVGAFGPEEAYTMHDISEMGEAAPEAARGARVAPRTASRHALPADVGRRRRALRAL